jgi:hypothetical protein
MVTILFNFLKTKTTKSIFTKVFFLSAIGSFLPAVGTADALKLMNNSSNSNHSFIVWKDGSAWGVGYGYDGQLGNRTTRPDVHWKSVIASDQPPPGAGG